MAFVNNMTDTVALDSSIVLAFDQAFIVAVGQANVMDQVAQYKQEIGAKSIQLTKYARLGLATTPLTETDDVASSAMSDTAVVFTPKEYGAAVTTTALAELQTGGKANIGAATIVGLNAGQTLDKLAILALDASTNVLSAGASTNMSVAFMNKMYNKLARASVPMINNAYVAIMHDDVIADLRAATGAGSWVDVQKYSSPETVLSNEVGMICGFHVIRDNQATVALNGAGGTDDIYNSYFLGANALGKVESKPTSIVLTKGSDKLGRFAHLGWYGVVAYGIVDQDAVFVGTSNSSVAP